MSTHHASKVIARVERSGDSLLAQPLFEGPWGPLLPLDHVRDNKLEDGSLVELDMAGGAWRLLAGPEDPHCALFDILSRHQVNPCFPEAVEREARWLCEHPGIDDPSLVDMTSLPFVTIDNDDSLDLDQALHIEGGPGGYIVRYALADGAYYVRPGMALFEEALRRGVSYYLPDFCVPMLPSGLSEGIVSLNPGVPRRSLVFEMTLDGQGLVEKTELMRARILSRAKLSYGGVQRYHDHRASSPLANQEYTRSLDLLAEVGRLRLAEASGRDVVSFNRMEVVVRLNGGQGPSFSVEREGRNSVNLWNEQISILCNMEGARILAQGAGAQAVFRVHESPSEEDLERLALSIERIVEVQGLERDLWCWRRRDGHGAPRESLADYLGRLPSMGTARRVRAAIERQILVINRRSNYTSEPGEHFALGVNPYCRFSSPMREIVGIYTHKEALERLGLMDEVFTPEEDELLRARVIDAANRSRNRQSLIDKEVTKLAVDQLLHNDLGLPPDRRPRYVGTILGMKATRLYVLLDDPPVELKLYTKDLEGLLGRSLTYREGDAVMALDGDSGPRFRTGDRIELQTHSYHHRQGKWLLTPL